MLYIVYMKTTESIFLQSSVRMPRRAGSWYIWFTNEAEKFSTTFRNPLRTLMFDQMKEWIGWRRHHRLNSLSNIYLKTIITDWLIQSLKCNVTSACSRRYNQLAWSALMWSQPSENWQTIWRLVGKKHYWSKYLCRKFALDILYVGLNEVCIRYWRDSCRWVARVYGMKNMFRSLDWTDIETRQCNACMKSDIILYVAK